MNGWTDSPEEERERLELCERPSGQRLVDSADHILHSRETLRASQQRLDNSHRRRAA